MNKEFKICIGVVLIGALGWVASKEIEKYQARKFAAEQQLLAAKAQEDLEIQKQKNFAELQAKKAQEREARHQQKLREEVAARQEIQDQLKTLKVSSILLGSPSLAIINKKSYEEGGDLSLPNGRVLKVAAIKNDGVMLVYGEQTFQVGLPVARDIGGVAQ